MAPISAVNAEPTCAASAIAAMSGVISRMLAKLPTSPVNDSAPICSQALEALHADGGAGEERHGEDHEHHAAADDPRARARRRCR